MPNAFEIMFGGGTTSKRKDAAPPGLRGTGAVPGLRGTGAVPGFRRETRKSDDLAEQVAALEALQQQTGAPKIEQEQPGFLARTVDVLSAFNFGTAGAYEELARGNGIGSAAKRFAAEVYSSARSLPFGGILPEMGGAQKEAFGEVFQQLGYKTTTLADVAPMMEGTFLGELFNTRGTIGLGADIFLDPTTYFTFGLSAVARRTLSRFASLGVKKGLSKKGLAKSSELERIIREAGEISGDDAIREAASRQIVDLGDASLFDPGGIKFAGVAIPGTAGIGKDIANVVSEPLVKVLNSRGIGRNALRTAEGYYDALKAIGRETFGEFSELERLTGPLRESARRVARKWVPATAKTAGRYQERVIADGYLDYFKKNPHRMEPWRRAIDDKAIDTLPEAEQVMARQLTGMTGEMGGKAVELDIITQAQFDANPDFLFHSWKGIPAGEAMETWRTQAKAGERLGNKHAMERVYKTQDIGENISTKRAAATQGLRSKGVPVEREVQLIADYSVEKFESDLLGYIDWYSKQETAHMMAREFSDLFGFDKAKWGNEVGRLIDGGQDLITPQHAEWDKVTGFFDNHPNIGKLDEESAWGGTGEKITGIGETMKDAMKHLDRITDPLAKRQFVKELMLHTRSVSQFVNVWDGLEAAGKTDLLPRTLLNLEGTAEDALLRFGEKAVYTSVGGNSLWGKGERMIPQLIADYVEGASSKILNTRDHLGFREMVTKWDRINNMFKNWVYPYFPSSQLRNAYSNVALSGLRISWHAIDPALHRHSVGILVGKKGSFVSKTGKVWDYDVVRELFQQNNIEATFRQLTEQTGEGLAKLPTPGVRGKIARGARKAITNVENEARYALGIQGLMDGLSVEEAAADVAEFLFNYNELGPIHREFIQRIIPFSTFTLKNIRAQTRALTSTPGRVINQLKPFRGRESENDQMVKFEAEGLKLRLDGDGKTVRMLTGIDLPLRNLDTLWAGGFGRTGQRILGMMSPVLKAPIEGITSTDLFTGSKLTRTQGNTLGRIIDASGTPKAVKDWLGYAVEHDAAGRPSYSFDGVRYQLLVRSFIFSRIMSTSDRQFREYVKDGNISGMMLDLLSGIRDKDLNMDDQKRHLLFRRRRELIQSLERRGVLDPFKVPGKPNLEGLR